MDETLDDRPHTPIIHSRSASRTSTVSTFSSQGDADCPRPHSNSKSRLSRLSGTPTKKAKRVRFYRNGDRFFKGVVMPVTPERYRSFDSLLSDVTRTLKDHVTLPNGVRTVFTMEGQKVSKVDDLEDGKGYVCSGYGESFKRIEYLNLSSRTSKPCKVLGGYDSEANRSLLIVRNVAPDFIRPKVVTLIRNGTRPRKIIRLLLNKRNAPSFEHALSSITDAVKLDTGAVRKVFSPTGEPVTNLQDFFSLQNVFFVYGSERFSPDDFQLDGEELKAIQAHIKSLPAFRRHGAGDSHNISTVSGNGVMPKMPKKRVPINIEPQEHEPLIPSAVRIRYKVGKVIGDGNFAVVRKCTDKAKGGDYAIKIIDKSKCKGREQMIENEVHILRKVRHPNIIRLVGEYDTSSELYLIMELEGGDLFDAIAASTKFSEQESSLMIQNLASALAYLHNRTIVHRDIKPENLLVRLDENMKVKSLKLGDFGLAQKVTEPLYAVCGTPTYVAPEILSEAGYGLKVDVWASGVILYILLCGFPPFVSTNDDQDELFDKILTGVFEFTSPYWDEISELSKDLIVNMLQTVPGIRFSAEDVLDHYWIKCSGGVDGINDSLNHNVNNSTRSLDCTPNRPNSSTCINYDLSG